MTNETQREMERLQQKNATLQQRVDKLARHNAHLSLVSYVLDELAPLTGVSDVIDRLIGLLVNNVGGINIAVYYVDSSTWYYRDLMGTARTMETLDDANVRQCIYTGLAVEYQAAETLLTFELGRQSSVRNWIYPMKAQRKVIGAIKYEGMLVHLDDEVVDQIQTISNYAAMAIQNEQLNTSRLKVAYDEVKEKNERLEREMAQRKKVQDEAAELQLKLQQAQKMEAIGTLAGGIAHDFNNILSAIIGFSELAVLGTEVPSVRRNLERVLEAGNRATELVRQILTFSRKNDAELQPTALQQILKEALKLLRATIPTSISIETAIDSNVGTVMGNAVQIHQVLMNLATNARHAIGEDNGTLRISLKQLSHARQQFSTISPEQTDSFVCMTVQDTGCGMSAEIQQRIFEPYFTTKSVYEGTGMGLAMVHGIMKACGGYIFVDSVPGEGTRFDCLFPTCDVAPVVETRQRPATHRRFAGTAMVVDDEEMILESLSAMLANTGLAVEAFNDSMRAHAAFFAAPDKYTIILTDQTMPRLSGIDLAKAVRSGGFETPIILFSGFSAQITQEALANAGVNEFIAKPYRRALLYEKLQHILG